MYLFLLFSPMLAAGLFSYAQWFRKWHEAQAMQRLPWREAWVCTLFILLISEWQHAAVCKICMACQHRGCHKPGAVFKCNLSLEKQSKKLSLISSWFYFLFGIGFPWRLMSELSTEAELTPSWIRWLFFFFYLIKRHWCQCWKICNFNKTFKSEWSMIYSFLIIYIATRIIQNPSWFHEKGLTCTAIFTIN